jgi:hypothetical protein
MAEPTRKSEGIENFLEENFGRTTAIRENLCVPPPIGCGKPVSMEDFRDEVSRKEYRISGLCQACQDQFFGV